MTLVATRRLQLRLRHGAHSVVVEARPAAGALDSLQLRGAELYVTLQRAHAAGTASAPAEGLAKSQAAASEASERAAEAARATQTVKHHLANGRREVETAFRVAAATASNGLTLQLSQIERALIGTATDGETAALCSIEPNDDVCAPGTPLGVDHGDRPETPVSGGKRTREESEEGGSSQDSAADEADGVRRELNLQHVTMSKAARQE